MRSQSYINNKNNKLEYADPFFNNIYLTIKKKSLKIYFNSALVLFFFFSSLPPLSRADM